MINEKHIIDIENYLLLIEGIAKKYIHIEDIDCCVFSDKLRYPLINKNVSGVLSREPQMSMYCGPMIRDIIKVLLARDSFYFKYFILDYKNDFSNEFTNRFNMVFKNDLTLLLEKNTILDDIVIKNFITEIYNFILSRITSLKDFDKILESIASEFNSFMVDKLTSLTKNNFLRKNGEITRIENGIFTQETCDWFISVNKDFFKSIHESFIKKSDENVFKVNDNGIFNIDTIIKNYLPGITNEELDYVYSVISKIDDNVLKKLPSSINDYIVEINDDYICHILTATKHILEVRLKEVEENKEC